MLEPSDFESVALLRGWVETCNRDLTWKAGVVPALKVRPRVAGDVI